MKPIYVYACKEHGTFESHERAEAQPCPTCGSKAGRVWLPLNWTWGTFRPGCFGPHG